MLNRFGFLFLLLVTPMTWAASKPVVNIQHWQTKNGVPVYFVAAKGLPILDVRMAFNAGASRDGRLAGLSAVTNDLIGQATHQANTQTIAAQFDSVGAQFEGHVDRDKAVLSLRTTTDPKQMKTALATFSDVLTDPTFPQDNVDRIKKQALLSVKLQDQDPNAVANKAFYQLLYHNTPYAHDPNGRADTLTRINAKAIQQFYQQYYVAHNAVMVLVGNISKKQAKHIAQQLVGKLSIGKSAAAIPLVHPLTPGTMKTIPFPVAQTTIMLGQVGINQHDPYYFPLYVGNYTLGGGAFASRLFKTVRVKAGLTYGIQSGFLPLQANGPFVISLKTRNQAAEQALTLTQQVLKQFLANGPSEAELIAAKKNITGRFAGELSSNNDIADTVLSMAFYHLPMNYLDQFCDNVNKVSIQDIRHAFSNTLNPNAMNVVLVGAPNANKK